MSEQQKVTGETKVPDRDLEALKTHFSHFFDKNGKFDIEKFKQNLSEKEINFSTESYGLDWLGKSYARLLASDPATTLLKADEAHNDKTENVNSENLLIKGDNLEVLKHLVSAYYEKIKMIYIDPPYNTGSDGFVYQDDRKFTAKELQQLAGVDEDKAKRILDFTKSSSNSHSAWLTFMYPRLYIAKQLLKDDGVIFVSIDDNEVAQLRLLMDEIFGEENFVAELIWNNEGHTDNQFQVKVNHEYVLLYSKYKTKTDLGYVIDPNTREGSNLWKGYAENSITKNGTDNPTSEVILPVGFPCSSETLELSKSEIDNTFFEEVNHIGYVNRSLTQKYNVTYPIRMNDMICSNYKLQKECVVYSGWANVNKLKIFINNNCNPVNDIEGNPYRFYLSENGVIYYRKEREKARNILSVLKNFGTTEQMRSELEKNGIPFSYPKPVSLIKYLFKIGVVDSDNNDLILDFFAGSGTSGESVMQLNAEDGGCRKYVLVQIPESIDAKKNKVAYDFVKNELKTEPTIFEITKERLIRAAKKVKTESIDKKIAEKTKEIKDLEKQLDLDGKKEQISKLKSEIKALQKQDLGFKVFETMPIWEDYNFEAEKFDIEQKLFDFEKLTDSDLKALLVTWKTYDGIPLTQDLEKVDLNGYNADYGNGKLYLMNTGFTTDSLKAMLEKIDDDKKFHPALIVAFGYHFESKNMREISENIKTYANKKHIDIDFVVRY